MRAAALDWRVGAAAPPRFSKGGPPWCSTAGQRCFLTGRILFRNWLVGLEAGNSLVRTAYWGFWRWGWPRSRPPLVCGADACWAAASACAFWGGSYSGFSRSAQCGLSSSWRWETTSCRTWEPIPAGLVSLRPSTPPWVSEVVLVYWRVEVIFPTFPTLLRLAEKDAPWGCVDVIRYFVPSTFCREASTL